MVNDHILAENGDRLMTESGDFLVLAIADLPGNSGGKGTTIHGSNVARPMSSQVTRSDLL